MLEVKRGDVKSKNVNTTVGQQDEAWFWKLYGEDVNDKANGWAQKIDLRDDKEGYSVTLWQRPQEKGGDVLSRGASFLPGITMGTYKQFIREFDKRTIDPKTVKELKILSRLDDGMPTKLYERIKMPLMSERELLLNMEFKALKGEHEGKFLWLICSGDDPAYPPKKGVIKMQLFKAAMLWPEDGGIKNIEFSTMNMGGYFPMRLLNMAIGSMMKG